jgi:hypothetical protein
LFGFGLGVFFGGGGRVRTRNTLHIVVARKSSICYNAVERRKIKKRKRENNKIQKYDKINILKKHEKWLLFP